MCSKKVLVFFCQPFQRFLREKEDKIKNEINFSPFFFHFFFLYCMFWLAILERDKEEKCMNGAIYAKLKLQFDHIFQKQNFSFLFLFFPAFRRWINHNFPVWLMQTLKDLWATFSFFHSGSDSALFRVPKNVRARSDFAKICLTSCDKKAMLNVRVHRHPS